MVCENMDHRNQNYHIDADNDMDVMDNKRNNYGDELMVLEFRVVSLLPVPDDTQIMVEIHEFVAVVSFSMDSPVVRHYDFLLFDIYQMHPYLVWKYFGDYYQTETNNCLHRMDLHHVKIQLVNELKLVVSWLSLEFDVLMVMQCNLNNLYVWRYKSVWENRILSEFI